MMNREIPQRLLNKTVDVMAVTQVYNSSGDMSNSETNVIDNLKMRIVNNKSLITDYGNRSSGKFINSTHIGFCSVNALIKVGHYIIDGDMKYSIDDIDFQPGGEPDHHYELGMSLIQPDR